MERVGVEGWLAGEPLGVGGLVGTRPGRERLSVRVREVGIGGDGIAEFTSLGGRAVALP